MKDQILSNLKYYDNDLNFKFDSSKHKYTYNDEVLTSVTQFISRFHQKFDQDFWSKEKAREEGVTQDEILSRWKMLNDRSNVIGTATHNWIENYFNCEYQPLPHDVDIIDRINKFNSLFSTHIYKLTPLKFEQKIFSKKWKLGGMIDSLFLYKEKIIIIDWKTNKKFELFSNYNEKLLHPFEEFDKCHLNEYSIQISLYSLILREIGIDVSAGYIFYIGPEKTGVYKTIDFRDKLEEYLNQIIK